MIDPANHGTEEHFCLVSNSQKNQYGESYFLSNQPEFCNSKKFPFCYDLIEIPLGSDNRGPSDVAECTSGESAVNTSEGNENEKKATTRAAEIYFLKIPAYGERYGLPGTTADSEIRKELKKKSAINKAKERLDVRTDELKKHGRDSQDPTPSRFFFSISKLYGAYSVQKTNPSGSLESIRGLLYEYMPGDSFAINTFGIASQIKSSKDFLLFAREFAHAIQKLHNQSIVHSFIVPRNLIVNKISDDSETPNGTMAESVSRSSVTISIVGFGYARLGSTGARQRQRTQGGFSISEDDKLYLAPECKAEADYTGFWFPADIYSVGAILYSLLCHSSAPGIRKRESAYRDKMSSVNPDVSLMGSLTSENIDVEHYYDILSPAEANIDNLIRCVLERPDRDVLRLKKTIGDILKSAAPDIVNANENILKIIDHCLRYDPETRFSCTEELIEAIEIALEAESTSICPTPTPKEDSKSIPPPPKDYSTVISLEDAVKRTDLAQMLLWPPNAVEGDRDLSSNLVLCSMIEHMIRDFREERAKLRLGHFEVFGSRDRIITSLCRMLCAAQEGWEYNTTTIPHYWLNENLGAVGRFLTMNKHKARFGVRIRRVFYVEEDNFHLLQMEEQKMLLEHLAAEDEISRFDGKGKGEFLVKVVKVSYDEINSFEREGHTVAYLRRPFNKSNNEDEPLGKDTAVSEDEADASSLCLNFYSATSEIWDYGKQRVNRKITKVRYWVPSAAEVGEMDSKFKEMWERGTPLKDYVGRGYSRKSNHTLRTPDQIDLKDLLNRRMARLGN